MHFRNKKTISSFQVEFSNKYDILNCFVTVLDPSHIHDATELFFLASIDLKFLFMYLSVNNSHHIIQGRESSNSNTQRGDDGHGICYLTKPRNKYSPLFWYYKHSNNVQAYSYFIWIYGSMHVR